MAAGRREGLRRAAERLSVTRRVVHRFVPGETIDSALNSVAALRDSGRFVSVDYLGEDVANADDADAAVRAYLDLIDTLGGPRRCGRRSPAAGSLGQAVGAGAVADRATGRRSRGRTPGRSALPPSVRACG